LTQTLAPATLHLGFLTVVHEANGYLGGYLVTNQWGRPLEFRLSTAVQPNRVQQLLYAGTLEPYLCADLIGKTLVEKAAMPVQLVLTDTQAVLDLRHWLDVPVGWLAPQDKGGPLAAAGQFAFQGGSLILPGPSSEGTIGCHRRFPQDASLIRQVLETIAGMLDLAEPFARIREAIGEARKMGVTAGPRSPETRG
jgi:hypothetical protein